MPCAVLGAAQETGGAGGSIPRAVRLGVSCTSHAAAECPKLKKIWGE